INCDPAADGSSWNECRGGRSRVTRQVQIVRRVEPLLGEGAQSNQRYWSGKGVGAGGGVQSRKAFCTGTVVPAKTRFTRVDPRVARRRDANAAYRIASRGLTGHALPFNARGICVHGKYE